MRGSTNQFLQVITTKFGKFAVRLNMGKAQKNPKPSPVKSSQVKSSQVQSSQVQSSQVQSSQVKYIQVQSSLLRSSQVY